MYKLYCVASEPRQAWRAAKPCLAYWGHRLAASSCSSGVIGADVISNHLPGGGQAVELFSEAACGPDAEYGDICNLID